MKLLGLAITDLHFHDWRAYSNNHSRLLGLEKIFKKISKQALLHKVPIFCPGDLIHNAKSIDNITLNFFVRFYSEYIEKKGIPFYVISGNHDMSEKNTITHSSPSYIDTFSRVFKTMINLDRKFIETDKFFIAGIPYLNKNKGFTEILESLKACTSKKKFKILMIHTDLHGAKSTEYHGGDPDEIPKDMDKYFSYFDLVLCGHIHFPQRLGKKIFVLGAPYQQTWTEKGWDLGYYEIYDKTKPKFKPLTFMPKFKEYEKPEEKDDFNFWAEKPKKQKTTDLILTGNFSATTNKVTLAKRYLKELKITDLDKKQALIKILKEL